MSRPTQDPASYSCNFAYGALTLSGLPSQTVQLTLPIHIAVLTPKTFLLLVWALPRSLATTCGIILIFSSYGYLDVSVPHVRLPYGMTGLQPAGLSHSEIFGSKVICTCPKLIAAYHVLHRLREPRHPPCALAYFLSNVLFSYWYW